MKLGLWPTRRSDVVPLPSGTAAAILIFIKHFTRHAQHARISPRNLNLTAYGLFCCKIEDYWTSR